MQLWDHTVCLLFHLECTQCVQGSLAFRIQAPSLGSLSQLSLTRQLCTVLCRGTGLTPECRGIEENRQKPPDSSKRRPQSKGSSVLFPVRAHAWVQSPVGVHTRGNWSVFLSLLPLPLKLNKIIKKRGDLTTAQCSNFHGEGATTPRNWLKIINSPPYKVMDTSPPLSEVSIIHSQLQSKNIEGGIPEIIYFYFSIKVYFQQFMSFTLQAVLSSVIKFCVFSSVCPLPPAQSLRSQLR